MYLDRKFFSCFEPAAVQRNCNPFSKMSKKKKSRDPEPMDDGGDYGMYEQKVVIQEDPIHGQLELTDKELETDVS